MLHNETEIWKYINKTRRKKEWIENEISKERWKQHFRRLLDGVSYEKAIGERENEETEMVHRK